MYTILIISLKSNVMFCQANVIKHKVAVEVLYVDTRVMDLVWKTGSELERR